MQALAFQLLAESYPPLTAAGLLPGTGPAAGAAGMVGGQVDDLAWEQSTRQAATAPLAVGCATSADGPAPRLARTGKLARASRCPDSRAHCAWASMWPTPPTRRTRKLLDRFDGYGRALGLAFQITDDLLDVEGQAGRTGKRVGKDAGRGKLTYPGLLGVPESRKRAERQCREAQDYLSPLGAGAAPLRSLADFVLTRDC